MNVRNTDKRSNSLVRASNLITLSLFLSLLVVPAIFIARIRLYDYFFLDTIATTALLYMITFFAIIIGSWVSYDENRPITNLLLVISPFLSLHLVFWMHQLLMEMGIIRAVFYSSLHIKPFLLHLEFAAYSPLIAAITYFVPNLLISSSIKTSV